MDYFFCCRN